MHFKPNVILKKVKFVIFYLLKNSKNFIKPKLFNIDGSNFQLKLTLRMTLIRDSLYQHII